MVGLQVRRDLAYLDRRHTRGRQILNYCEIEHADGPATPIPAVNGACNADNVRLLDLGGYVEDTTRWTPWLRTVLGVREEYYQAATTA